MSSAYSICPLPTPPPLLWYACIQVRQARGVASEWPCVTQAHFADSETKMLKRLVADRHQLEWIWDTPYVT